MEDKFLANLFIVSLVIYGTSIHEMGHAYVSTLLGDPTPARHGRLTLNPIPHLNPVFTAILLPLIMFMGSGGSSLMTLALTPIDPARYRRPLLHHAFVALAGPLMNLLFMSVMLAILWIPGVWNRTTGIHASYVTYVFFFAALWELVMAAFNLMPLPPLDGYWIIRGVLPLPIRRMMDSIASMGLVSMVLVMIVAGYVVPYLLPGLFRIYFSLLPQ